jgi:hypothetical protein
VDFSLAGAVSLTCQPRSATRSRYTVPCPRRRTSRSGCTRALCTTRSIELTVSSSSTSTHTVSRLSCSRVLLPRVPEWRHGRRLPCQLREGLGYGRADQQVKASCDSRHDLAYSPSQSSRSALPNNAVLRINAAPNAAPLARRARRAQPLGGPPGARRPQPARPQTKSGSHDTLPWYSGHSRLPRSRLSSSQPPRQWRPYGPVARDRLRRPLTGTRSQGFGACEAMARTRGRRIKAAPAAWCWLSADAVGDVPVVRRFVQRLLVG